MAEDEITITGKGTPRELDSALLQLAGVIRGQEAVSQLGKEGVDDIDGKVIKFWDKPVFTVNVLHKDKVGTNIEKFDEVYVPEPCNDDIHNFEFTGCVDGFRNGNALVSDNEGECFELEPERLIKV